VLGKLVLGCGWTQLTARLRLPEDFEPQCHDELTRLPASFGNLKKLRILILKFDKVLRIFWRFDIDAGLEPGGLLPSEDAAVFHLLPYRAARHVPQILQPADCVADLSCRFCWGGGGFFFSFWDRIWAE
jgi:hypothetical protein